MGLNLCIDIGNSRTKVGEFEDDRFLRSHTFTNDEVVMNSMMLDEMPIEALILSSVNQKISDQLALEKKAFPYIVLDQQTPLPIQLKYRSPETLGKDRIAAAVGVKMRFPGQASLAIDVGTCITYDLLNRKGEYLGGAISPGIQMRLKAMHFGTDSLPLIQWEDKTKLPGMVGDSTISSMLSGVVNGISGEIRSFIKAYRERETDLKVILCGGDAEFFEKELKNGIFADPNLVLKGLNEILLYNLS